MDNVQKNINQTQASAEKIAQDQKAKFDNLSQEAEDKINGLKDKANKIAIDPKAAIIAVVLPLLTKFIKAEKAGNAIINKLIRDTKRKLKNKGRVVVNNGAIVFVPKDKADYTRYKQNFDNKVASLKKIVKTLKTIIDLLIKILKTLKMILIGLKVQLAIQKKKLQAQAAAASADLSGPQPNKPAATAYTTSDRLDEDVTKPLEKKIDEYLLYIAAIQTILQIFQKMINSLKIKLETLSFTISQNSTLTPLNQVITDTMDDLDETEYSDGIKQYTIKVVTTPSGALQAVAYDKFSMMKITQTAPSKSRRADELINELKQILG